MSCCKVAGLIWLCLVIFIEAQPLPQRGPPPLPPPPPGASVSRRKPQPLLGCDDDLISVQKFHKESCSNDSDCYGGPSSMVCVNKICQCTEGFEPVEKFVGEKGTQPVCVSSPALFSKCKETCQKPAKCLLYTGEGSDGKVKVCQCAKPYVLKDNNFCYLECGPNEAYDYSQAKCIPTCKSNEVNVKGVCKPLSGLGGKCDVDKQCLSLVASCIAGVCSCSKGFVRKGDLCVPEVINCPEGEAFKQSGNYQLCSVFESDDTESAPQTRGFRRINVPKRKDDCPQNYRCLTLTSTSSSGYCCPKIKIKCPVGEPHPRASCGVAFTSDGTYCPPETHFCHGSSRGGSDKEVCCPNLCPSDTVLKNGQCYPQVGVGGQCQFKEQCSREFSDCVSGKCQCVEGSKQGGDLSSPFCDLSCADDEVRAKSKCEKRFKLGEKCTKDQENRCPEYAFCNKDNLCACRCGTFTLAENTCAPAPICQPVIFPVPYGVGAAADKAGLPPIPRISDEEREKLLKNVTMCEIHGKKAPGNLKVGQCQPNQFCSRYITNVGLCCAKPEPFCYGPEKPVPNKKCEPGKPFSCGLNAFCSVNYQPLDKAQGATDGTVCCPKPPSDDN